MLNPSTNYLAKSLKRIDKYVDKSQSDCWIWTGGYFPDGYPGIWFDNHAWRGNRLMCALKHGYRDSKWSALHSCDNPKCINPDHLRWGTVSDNSADMVARNRSCKNDKNPSAKLTIEQVKEIIALKKQGARSVILAEIYGVRRQTIQSIYAGRSWNVERD
jgi:hypothetical protein